MCLMSCGNVSSLSLPRSNEKDAAAANRISSGQARMLECSFSDAQHNLQSARKGPLPSKIPFCSLSALPLFGREIRRYAVDLRDPCRCFHVLARLIRRQDLTVQLRPQIVPACLQDVPVPFIISAFKDDGMDMDAGSLSGRTRLLPLYHFFLPQTADAVHPADLLFPPRPGSILDAAGPPCGRRCAD